MAGATKYQRLQKASKAYCEGRGSKKTVSDAAKEYVKDAVAKGKTKTEAERTASRAQKCTANLAGTKKRKSTGTKKTTSRRKTTAKRKPTKRISVRTK